MLKYRQLKRYPPDRKYLFDRLLRTGTMVLAILLVLYLLYHIGDGFQTKLETDFAVEASCDKTVTMDAYIFRDEQVLTAPSGIVRYYYDDYEKVEANGLVATVYSSTSFENRLAISRIDSLNRQIELLTESAARAQLLTNEGATNTAISSALSALRYEVQNGRYGTALSKTEEFYLQLSRRELQQSSKPNYQEEIQALTAARNTFVSSLEATGSATSLYAGDKGGYFTRVCDGYEGIFDYASVMTMSLSAFNAMIETSDGTLPTASQQTVGKMIGSYQWYAVARADRITLEKFNIGNSYSVSFPDNENSDVTMKLVRAVAESGSKDVLLIFSCNQMPNGFTYTRHQNITVTYDTVSGLKVSRSSIHEIDGKPFVYILYGAQIQLRAVTILDRLGGYYYIDPDSPSCTIESGDEAGTYRGLSRNDCVIIYGVNLYHGRIFS